MDDFTYDILNTLHKADSTDDLWWRVDDGKVSFYIACNDIFYWACSDLEEITPENLQILKDSYKDAGAGWGGEGEWWGGLLFCARVRGMRPQGAFYKGLNDKGKELFDAVGPEREIDITNPFNQENEYLYKK